MKHIQLKTGKLLTYRFCEIKKKKHISPPEEKYLVLDKGKLDVNKLK